jgi:hypothetical protein
MEHLVPIMVAVVLYSIYAAWEWSRADAKTQKCDPIGRICYEFWRGEKNDA